MQSDIRMSIVHTCIDENQRLILSLFQNVNMPVILHSVSGYVCEVGDRGQCIHPFNF